MGPWQQPKVAQSKLWDIFFSFSYAIQEKYTAWRVNSTLNFTRKNRYRTNREEMSAISVFQGKFNVEFTRQAVNFSWIA